MQRTGTQAGSGRERIRFAMQVVFSRPHTCVGTDSGGRRFWGTGDGDGEGAGDGRASEGGTGRPAGGWAIAGTSAKRTNSHTDRRQRCRPRRTGAKPAEGDAKCPALGFRPAATASSPHRVWPRQISPAAKVSRRRSRDRSPDGPDKSCSDGPRALWPDSEGRFAIPSLQGAVMWEAPLATAVSSLGSDVCPVGHLAAGRM